MHTADFLVELGTEELPPKTLLSLSQAFAEHLQQSLVQHHLTHQPVEVFAAPRRLALLVPDLQLTGQDEQQERRGPALQAAYDAEGKPSKAALGFAASCGVDFDQLQTLETKKGSYLVHRSVKPGQPTASLLPEMISQALAALPIAKRMRWGSSRAEFVRPVKWLVMLLGADVVEAELLGLKADRISYGHRFHAPEPVVLNQADDYEAAMFQAKVMADFSKRRAVIADQVNAKASEFNAQAVIDPDLLDEVTALNEWPQALCGSFDAEFLQVPAEALISSMKEHQKYFHLLQDAKLLNRFITISNIQSSNPQAVIAGNEKVIRPRLADAKFFWDTDRKHPLVSRLEKLKTVLFQKELGTLFDKTQRLIALAEAISSRIGGEPALAARAAQLSKCDLLSEMVFEFTELQGLAGSYYAAADGEHSEVAAAIAEQYKPAFAGDSLPQSKSGMALALAERLDTLVGIFGIGQPPTGTKDPFALRRASLGVLRILLEQGLDLDLAELLALARQQHSNLKVAEVEAQVLSYLLDRFAGLYQEQGIDQRVFAAVRSKNLSNALDIDQRVKAVAHFSALPEADSLAAANKRVANLLAKNPIDADLAVSAELLSEPAEQALAQALSTAQAEVAPLLAARQYQQALVALAALRPAVDAFFDQVMVMADDQQVRNNRLALLQQLRALFLEVADLALLG